MRGAIEAVRLTMCAMLAALALLAVPAHAQADEEIRIDAQRSHAEFEIRALWLFDVEGHFGSVGGTVRINEPAQHAQVEALIDARAIDMRRDSYETWVKSEEFFNVAKFPQIRFLSQPFPLATLELGGDIVGTLTVRGVTQQASFRVQPSQCAIQTTRTCPVIADGNIQRSDFGMTTRRATLSDKVRLHFTIYAEAQAERS